MEKLQESGAEYFRGVKARSSVDNLLRTVQQHHVQLSLMADTKASIVITVSSIIATISLSRSGDPGLRPALLTLAVACLTSLILAIIAVLPTFSKKKGSRNLLFFGHFASMTEDEYMRAFEQIIASDDALYEIAVRDIYSLGTYLHRKKYRFLRFSYIALIAGFLMATLVEMWVVVR
ncbi:MAG TPA: Pycsar system effector family protein [Thermoanaerobaculia bacterium]|nr:Pycsar system effector family protein [Thermoanaerobaculia bacterium]